MSTDVARLRGRAQAWRMALLDKINADLKQAMLDRDDVTRDTLRMLKSELSRLDDPDELGFLSSSVKSRKDSIKSYLQGGRQDLADKEQAEIDVIERYLPKPLTEAEVQEAVQAIIADVGASTKRDMGKVITELKARYPARVDGKMAAAITGKLLG